MQPQNSHFGLHVEVSIFIAKAHFTRRMVQYAPNQHTTMHWAILKKLAKDNIEIWFKTHNQPLYINLNKGIKACRV